MQSQHKQGWRKRLGLFFGALAALAVITQTHAGTEVPTSEAASSVDSAATHNVAQQIRSQLIDNARRRWPQAAVTVQLNLPPKQLRLRSCTALEVTPRGTRVYGRIPVALRCSAPTAWQLFAQAQVQVELPVAIAAKPIPRGHTLASGDVTLAPRNLSELRSGFVTDLSHAMGYLSSRPLNPEAVLYSNTMKRPITVPKGQRVSIAGGRGLVRIGAQGEALEPGMRGEQIKVRNLQSGRELHAWVVGPGRVSRHWPNPES